MLWPSLALSWGGKEGGRVEGRKKSKGTHCWAIPQVLRSPVSLSSFSKNRVEPQSYPELEVYNLLFKSEYLHPGTKEWINNYPEIDIITIGTLCLPFLWREWAMFIWIKLFLLLSGSPNRCRRCAECWAAKAGWLCWLLYYHLAATTQLLNFALDAELRLYLTLAGWLSISSCQQGALERDRKTAEPEEGGTSCLVTAPDSVAFHPTAAGALASSGIFPESASSWPLRSTNNSLLKGLRPK